MRFAVAETGAANELTHQPGRRYDCIIEELKIPDESLLVEVQQGGKAQKHGNKRIATDSPLACPINLLE